MLKRACICVAILSFLVVMGLPLAQASTERRIKVNVPFDFYMRDRVLSAGEYEVREIATGILVRSADGSEQLIALTRDAAAQGRQAAGARLVFHRYGDQSFLAAAWMDESNGHALSASRRERSLRTELAQGGHEVAPEVITVVAENAVQ